MYSMQAYYERLFLPRIHDELVCICMIMILTKTKTMLPNDKLYFIK